MNKDTAYILAGAGAMLVAAAIGLTLRCREQRAEIDRLEGNTAALMGELQEYTVRDSIHVAKARTLQLTIDELKTYRAEDAKVIRDLGVKNRDLEAMLTASAETIRQLEGRTADTVVVTRERRDTLKRITFNDRWLDLDIVLQKGGQWQGDITHRLDLAVVLETKYKRFLGFLWRTGRVDHRQVHVTAPEDPYTRIEEVTLVEIER